jgi:hypothetical protein
MRTLNAIRVQRHYRRQLAGRTVLPIEVDEAALVHELISSGLLSQSEADNKIAVTKALERAVGIIIEKGYTL